MSWGTWLKIGVGVALVAATGGFAAAGFLILGSSLLTSAVIGIGANLALGGIASAIRKPLSGSLLNDPNGRLQSIRQAAAVRRVIYGYTRVGGVLTFGHANGLTSHPTDQNQLIYTLTGHAIDSIQAIQFDDEFPDIDVPTGYGYGPYTNKLFFKYKYGLDGDVSLSPWFVGVTPWTTTHRQRGCAAAYVRINYDEKIFPNGVPNITFHVKGKPVFDPRTDSPITITAASNATPIVITAASHGLVGGETIRITGVAGNTNTNGTWGVDYISSTQFSLQGSNGNAAYTSGGQIFKLGWTANCALVTADHLLDPWTGLGVAYSRINQAVLIASANICDEPITIVSSPLETEDRYTFNGTFETSEQHGELLTQMANAMAGHVTNIGGEWHIIAGAFRASSLELTDADIVGPMQVQSKRKRSDLVNGIKGTFPSSAHGWVETDFPAVAGATYLAADNGVRVWKDIFLPFTSTATAAQRLAAIELERNRRQYALQIVCSMRAYELQPGDVVEVTHPKYTWAAKSFEVAECGLEQKDGALVTALQLIETDVDVYGFTVDEYGNTIDPDLMDMQKRKVPFGWSPQMAPGQIQTATATPLHQRTDYSFSIAQQYQMAADGSAIPQLRIGGFIAVNLFSDLITRPRTKDFSADTATTGGYIAGDERYYIAVAGRDTVPDGRLTPLSEIAVVEVPAGTATNTVTISGLRWHASNAGWVLYFGTDPHRLSNQTGATYSGTLGSAVSVTGPEARPTSITYKGQNVPGHMPRGYNEHLRGAPDAKFDKLEIVATRAEHLGIWGGPVVSTGGTGSPVGEPYTITLAADFAIGSPPAVPDYGGRYVSLVGQRDTGFEHIVGGGMPLADFLIASNTADTLTLATGQADPSTFFLPGTVVVIRTKATAVGADYIEDTGFGAGGQDFGDQDPNVGALDDSLAGRVIRGIFGTGIGESRIITSNIVATKRIYIEGDNPFAVDSVFVVLDSHPSLVYESDKLAAASEEIFIDLRLDAGNLYSDQYFVEVISVGPDGEKAPNTSSPYREIYLFGQADPGILRTTSSTLTPLDGRVRATGTITLTLPDPTTLAGRQIVITNVGSGTVTIAAADIDGSPTDTLEAGETGVYGAYNDA